MSRKKREFIEDFLKEDISNSHGREKLIALIKAMKKKIAEESGVVEEKE